MSPITESAFKQRLAEAAAALERQQPEQAERQLVGLPAQADSLRLLGIAQQQRGRHAAAAATFRRALALRPEDALLHNDLGGALRRVGQTEAAIEAFRRATQLAPTFVLGWYNLGVALKSEFYVGEARGAFEKTLELDPRFAPAWGSLGDTLKAQGDIDGAVKAYRTGIAYPQTAAQTWYHLADVKTVPLGEDDVAALQALLVKPELRDNDRIYAGYALAKALEDVGRYADAISALDAASRLKRSRLSWDAPAFSTLVSAIDAAFRTASHPADDAFGSEVVFVVSLPRSGSTLVEQILSAHSQIEGANELQHLHLIIDEESRRRGREFPHWVHEVTPAEWRKLGEDYLARTARWRKTKPRFTDKGLTNWLFVGAATAMLPGARFVDCRRDPLETCFSCYRQLFSNGNDFSYDVRELAAYWRDHDRLSRTWTELYPTRFREQSYEALVESPEANIRALLDFLGLEFEPACLDFHHSARAVRTASAAQVRQPLKRGTARAAAYGTALDPLRNALADVQHEQGGDS
ncbi:MAG TPA: sulfotransferase [Rudaea sp.]|nr:sulfotransferase [Rudaea sp.]